MKITTNRHRHRKISIRNEPRRHESWSDVSTDRGGMPSSSEIARSQIRFACVRVGGNRFTH